MLGAAKQVCVSPAAGGAEGRCPSACGLTPAYFANNEGTGR